MQQMRHRKTASQINRPFYLNCRLDTRRSISPMNNSPHRRIGLRSQKQIFHPVLLAFLQAFPHNSITLFLLSSSCSLPDSFPIYWPPSKSEPPKWPKRLTVQLVFRILAGEIRENEIEVEIFDAVTKGVFDFIGALEKAPQDGPQDAFPLKMQSIMVH